MKYKKRLGVIVFCYLFSLAEVSAQTDWPIFGHDPGGMRFSPLKQINTANVGQLRLAWQFDTAEADAPPATDPISTTQALPPQQGGVRQRGWLNRSLLWSATSSTHRLDTTRSWLSMQNTGHKIWEYESKHTPALRGVSYWPGTKGYAPAIVFGTLDGWLISLNAKTGKPNPAFGVEGMVNLRIGVTEKFPKARYAITSPPSFYKNW